MITLNLLQKFLDDYLHFDKQLDAEKIDPRMANGLMVRGKEEIGKIGFAVSASLSLFEKAKDYGYGCLVVHHAFNLPPYNRYDRIFQERIAYLVRNNISLFGYHFLLDSHPEIGNNVMILKTIKAKPVGHYLHHAEPWGYQGIYPGGMKFEEIIGMFKPHMSDRSKIYDFGAKEIKKVVAVSGKGAPYSGDMQRLIDEGVDLYITGEDHEWNRELFREAKINFIAGGHYATEVFGIKALMEKVDGNFPDVDCEWIDLPNDV